MKINAKKINKLAIGTIWALVSVVVLILIFLLGYILVTGLSDISWKFLTSTSSSISAGGGIRDQLFNSVYLLVLTIIISLPISLGAGIYLAEYAKDNWITTLIKTAIEVLSSLPSIVVGLFGYLILVIKFQLDYSILSGAIALTIFNLPLLTRSVEDSIEEVPKLQREAGLSLGLSKSKTIVGVVLPLAIPGIITGVILSSGRIFGEAAALIYTAGQSAPIVSYTDWNPFSPSSFLNPMRPAETLAVHIWKLNTEGIVPDAHIVSSGASAVLIIVILIFNLSSRFFGNWAYRKMTGTTRKKRG
ncbi:phosphate ABC transporter, permease protein PstA [Fructilactobacillus fructivorans]|nr:phosphate ABC transporter, permease protein PstA [Fructilactobacillus fructivorans]